ncbi:hypothetical protein FAM22277_02225 [Lacticaseibacillus paracasei]|uniref:ComC/BlpC family leader-containing pheromone/bacteriocin n=1 Tax=Lacticaseibacillus paracasei TaxID=1597 RepID=UPI000F0B8DFB|nr:ComC/BlpC family leader-containing pheromone/bacteriocin [Lacticaseibacillus paracasei]RNE01573.1 hypothetical protein FAM22277_02225 [Lacticaseibacillus paracasei]
MQQFMTLDNSSLEKIAGGENGGLWSIIGFGLGFSARSVLTGSLFGCKLIPETTFKRGYNE